MEVPLSYTERGFLNQATAHLILDYGQLDASRKFEGHSPFADCSKQPGLRTHEFNFAGLPFGVDKGGVETEG